MMGRCDVSIVMLLSFYLTKRNNITCLKEWSLEKRGEVKYGKI